MGQGDLACTDEAGPPAYGLSDVTNPHDALAFDPKSVRRAGLVVMPGFERR